MITGYPHDYGNLHLVDHFTRNEVGAPVLRLQSLHLLFGDARKALEHCDPLQALRVVGEFQVPPET